MESVFSSLGINVAAVVWHAINFLILLWILQRFLYKPVLKMLDDRSTRIRESLAQAEAARAETSRLQDESRGILDEARRQGQTVLANANQNAERIMAEARQLAQAEGDRLIERARSEIARERDQAFQELRQEIAGLAVAAAGRVINRSLDDSAHRELVREFLDEDPDSRRS